MEHLPPVKRMREYIEALHAIWDCWENGTKLNYQGEIYKLDLMIPYYNPGPLEFGRPPVYLAAINKLMCQLCGKMADGHLPGDPITNKWFEEVMLPNLEIGAKKSDRSLSDIDLGSYGFIGCSTTDEGLERMRNGLKERVALYAATPEYKEMLDMHGWQVNLGDFIDMARAQKWREMAELVSDEMLQTYAVIEKTSGPAGRAGKALWWCGEPYPD